MKTPRFYANLDTYLRPNKVLVIYGPRQAGKTTLLSDYLVQCHLKYKLDSGDNLATQHLFSSGDVTAIKNYVKDYDLIALDEAQRIPGIGLGLKIVVDSVPNIRIIATGSSSFALSGELGEPLTGRKTTLTLFPIAQLELKKLFNPYELQDKLQELLVFGNYPEIITTNKKEEKIRILNEIAQSYLLKDILELEQVRNSKVLLDLLRLLAFQVGNEVSLSELATQLGIDYKTVGRYLDLFEKAFVIFNVRGFCRNLRQEITNKSKYYFFDNGIMNAIVSNFNDIPLRNDIGALWENFIFMERLKKRSYQDIFANTYFWRTWEQKEVDLIEEREGKLFGYEIKWKKERVKPPKQWIEAYPGSSFDVITEKNYSDFVA